MNTKATTGDALSLRFDAVARRCSYTLHGHSSLATRR